MGYVLKSGEVDVDYQPRGGALELIYAQGAEIIIVGPAETGKTLACCWKVHAICSKYPGAQVAIIRKSQKSMAGTVLQTFGKVIEGAPVQVYGGDKPEKYIYPNGSMVWIGGMDNSDKVLSAERDMIYVNQAEELILSDWETLTTRTTGRAGNVAHPQLIGDANPSGSQHWIRKREGVQTIKSIHQDNPMLYDDDGNLTKQGKRTMKRLASLTGVRYKRLFLGEWATAEGAVYDMFQVGVHVKERNLDEFHQFALACDEGYTNPAVILLVGIDNDGRWHVSGEYYERGKLESDVVNYALSWTLSHSVSVAAVDASAASLIAAMRNSGVPATAAKGRVLDGIRAIQDRLKVQDDGKPRLTVSPSCINLINEFESYVWKPEKDEPVKDNDHALDALRYLENALQYSWAIY